MPTKLRSKIFQGIAVSSASAVAAFFVWTKHCKVGDIQPTSDPIFATKWYKKFNAHANPTIHDEVVRRIPLFKLRPELVKDAKAGGSKLVEAFSQGVWGTFGMFCCRFCCYLSAGSDFCAWLLFNKSITFSCQRSLASVILCTLEILPLKNDNASRDSFPASFIFDQIILGANLKAGILTKSSTGYTIQRLYLQNKYRTDTTTAHQLWDQPALLNSSYNTGTEITDHFVVLDKTPTSILIRCGDSPLNSPNDPRPSDGLFEITATTDFDKGFAEFRLKSVFFQGEGEVKDRSQPPMPAHIAWLHQQYAKLWMESAMRHLKQ